MGGQKQKTLRTFRSPKALAGVSRANRNDLTSFGVLSMRVVQRQAAEFSVERLLNERPEYLVVNGSLGAISKLHPLRAKIGETAGLSFGVDGS